MQLPGGGRPGRQGPLRKPPTLLKNQSSASLRFFSAIFSYWSRISFRMRLRSTPGAASISTLISPPTWPRRAFISCGGRDGGVSLWMPIPALPGQALRMPPTDSFVLPALFPLTLLWFTCPVWALPPLLD